MLFLAGAVLVGCTKKPLTDEEVIRGIIDKVARAAEKKDIQSIKKTISKSYHDSHGNDYDAINGFLLAHFFRSEKVGVTLTVSEAFVEGEKAKSHTEAFLTRVQAGSGVGGYLARDADYYRFDLVWQKEEGEWKLLSASWGPMSAIEAPKGEVR